MIKNVKLKILKLYLSKKVTRTQSNHFYHKILLIPIHLDTYSFFKGLRKFISRRTQIYHHSSERN